MKEITSPGFSSGINYAPNLRCRWKLRNREALKFDIHITDLDIEKSDGCQNDNLLITEEAVYIAKLILKIAFKLFFLQEPEDASDIIHTGLQEKSTRLGYYSV